MKKDSDQGFYDDGVFLQFDNSETRPMHVHVEVNSGSQEFETCDIRLTTLEKKEEDIEESQTGVTTAEDRLEETVTQPDESATIDEEVESTSLTEEQKEELKRQLVEIIRPPELPEDLAKKSFKDVFFFRLGYLNYAKLNTENMVFKFEQDQWYSLDFFIDWDTQ